MALKNPIQFFLIFIFVIVNLVDLITFWFILPGEANPLFLITNSAISIVVVKILIIGLIIHYYRRNIYPSHFAYFMIMLAMILGTLVVGLGAYSNIVGINNPDMVEEAAKIPAIERAKDYAVTISILYCIPFGLSLLAFHLYYKSLTKIKIDSEYYKKFKWWQI